MKRASLILVGAAVTGLQFPLILLLWLLACERGDRP